jgi:hypothetical protein
MPPAIELERRKLRGINRLFVRMLQRTCQYWLKIPHSAGRKFPHLLVVNGLQFQPVGAKMEPAGEAEAGNAGEQPAKE